MTITRGEWGIDKKNVQSRLDEEVLFDVRVNLSV